MQFLSLKITFQILSFLRLLYFISTSHHILWTDQNNMRFYHVKETVENRTVSRKFVMLRYNIFDFQSIRHHIKKNMWKGSNVVDVNNITEMVETKIFSCSFQLGHRVVLHQLYFTKQKANEIITYIRSHLFLIHLKTSPLKSLIYS